MARDSEAECTLVRRQRIEKLITASMNIDTLAVIFIDSH